MFFCKINIIGFQTPATPIMEGIVDFHNYVFFYLILIFFFVLWMFCYIMYVYYIVPTWMYEASDYHLILSNRISFFEFLRKRVVNHFFDNSAVKLQFGSLEFKNILLLIKEYFYRLAVKAQIDSLKSSYVTAAFVLELLWTLIPEIILILIAVPSIGLLVAMDEVYEPAIIVKSTGHQWFWSYSYMGLPFDINVDGQTTDSVVNYEVSSVNPSQEWDSVMIPESELNIGSYRLLEVDNQLILPVRTHIRIMVAAADVLHSWAVPALGVKMDAIPGKINQVGLYILYEGVYYGQCSELCGVNHGFMPIVVKAISSSEFFSDQFINNNF